MMPYTSPATSSTFPPSPSSTASRVHSRASVAATGGAWNGGSNSASSSSLPESLSSSEDSPASLRRCFSASRALRRANRAAARASCTWRCHWASDGVCSFQGTSEVSKCHESRVSAASSLCGNHPPKAYAMSPTSRAAPGTLDVSCSHALYRSAGHSSLAAVVVGNSGLPSVVNGRRSSTATSRHSPAQKTLTAYLPAGLYRGRVSAPFG